MSLWSHVKGTVEISVIGETQADIEYRIQTTLNHLPVMSGVEIYINKMQGTNWSSNCDELWNTNTNQMKKQKGWIKTQSTYALTLNGDFCDVSFEHILKKIANWIVRLGKRVIIQNINVMIYEDGTNRKYLCDNKFLNLFDKQDNTCTWFNNYILDRLEIRGFILTEI